MFATHQESCRIGEQNVGRRRQKFVYFHFAAPTIFHILLLIGAYTPEGVKTTGYYLFNDICLSIGMLFY